jgi:hypothetical protein
MVHGVNQILVKQTACPKNKSQTPQKAMPQSTYKPHSFTRNKTFTKVLTPTQAKISSVSIEH